MLYDVFDDLDRFLFRASLDMTTRILSLRREAAERIKRETTNGGWCQLYRNQQQWYVAPLTEFVSIREAN